MKDLEEFGTTDGCPQCSHVRAFRENKAGMAHTEACRKRIVEAMKAKQSGQPESTDRSCARTELCRRGSKQQIDAWLRSPRQAQVRGKTRLILVTQAYVMACTRGLCQTWKRTPSRAT